MELSTFRGNYSEITTYLKRAENVPVQLVEEDVPKSADESCEAADL